MYLQMFGLELKNMSNFTHLKLWIAVALHNLKWVKITFLTLRLKG